MQYEDDEIETSVILNWKEFLKRLQIFTDLTNIEFRNTIVIWGSLRKKERINLVDDVLIKREDFMDSVRLEEKEKEIAWNTIVDPVKVLTSIVPTNGVTSIRVDYFNFRKFMTNFLYAKYGHTMERIIYDDLSKQIINNLWEPFEKIKIPSGYTSSLAMKFFKEKNTITYIDFILRFKLTRHIEPEEGFENIISIKDAAWDYLVKGLSHEPDSEEIETSQEDIEKMKKELKESSYTYASDATPRGSNEEAYAEAARKLAEEKASGKSLKGVTILATMHGGLIFHNIPEDIKNKYIMVTNSGKCGMVTFRTIIGESTDLPTITSVKRVFKSVKGPGEILEGDRIIANANKEEKDTGMGTFPDGTRVPTNTSMESYRKWYSRQSRDTQEEDIQSPEYTKYGLDRLLEETKSNNAPAGTHGNSFIRTHTDMLKVWAPDPRLDFTTFTKYGLYIVTTHHCEDDPLLKSLETWSSNEYDAGDATLTPHETDGLYVLNRNLSFHNVFQKLQSLFELNGRIIPSISSSPAHPRIFEVGGVRFNGSQYKSINLLTLVRCFLEMGFEFVNIVDTSCQIVRLPGDLTSTISGTPEDIIQEGKPVGMVRQASLNSTQQGSDIMQHLMDTRTGGRRRRRKQATRKKRNRKSRKGRKHSSRKKR
jgi:hypothetical protein